MSQILPGSTQILDSVPFPLPGPGSDYQFVGAIFWPAFFAPPNSDCDFVEHEIYTANLGDININQIASSIEQGFANHAEGTPLAIRIFHKEIFDVSLPDEVCIPDTFLGVPIPYVGGVCQAVPFGGTTVASAHHWRIQTIYHNPLPLVVVIALAILAVIGVVVAINLLTHGKINLLPQVIQVIKDFSPAGEAQAIISVLAVGAGLVIWLLSCFLNWGHRLVKQFGLGLRYRVMSEGVR